jgi:hypothetical protein
MPTQLQLRRGTTAQHNSFTGAIGEVTVNTTKKTAVVHDGSTAGGLELLRADMSNVFSSATPTITSLNTSGNVDVGGNLTVTGTSTFNGGTITVGDADTDNVVFGADVNSNILPNTDNTFTLGNSSKKWADVRTVLLTTTGAATLGSTLAVTGNLAVNTNKFTVNATTGDVLVDGNLQVNGTTTTINSTTLTVDDKNIELASSASPTDALADGGGITIKGTTDKTLNWILSTNAFTSSENIETAAGKTLALSGSSSGKTTINVASTASGTLTLPSANDTLVGKATTDTLTNKSISLTTNTLTATSAELATAISDETGTGSLVFGTSPTLTTPVISSIVNTGTLTLPTSNDTLVGRATTDTLTNKSISLTTNTISGTLAEFNTALSGDDFVSLTGAETLTNKTLTSPIISTISNTGTLTLPTSNDTLVGRATTDTLTNKTLTEAKIANGGFIADANGNEQLKFTTTASAVNELTITNASTGNRPIISSTGNDTNIGISITPKGSGTIVAGSHFTPSSDNSLDLGTSALRWRDLYISGSSIVMGNTKIKMHADGYLQFNSNSAQNFPIANDVSVATKTNGVAATNANALAYSIALGG